MEAGARSREAARVEILFVFLFFFNTFLLPQGITLSLLLTPVWLYLLHRQGRLFLLPWTLALLGLYALLHIWQGVDLFYYSVSTTMLICIIICCLAVWPYLNSPELHYDRLLTRLVKINFVFALLAIPLLFLPPLKTLVWYIMSMSEGIGIIPRLKLFTYEASHYSFLIAPLVIYAYARAMFVSLRGSTWLLFMITLPLAMSLSFGVIACLLISGLVVVLAYLPRIVDTPRKRALLVISLCLLAVAGYLAFVYFPDNIFSLRFRNMLSGKDTSARGRTYESFILAHKIVSEKSYWWGIGPGQLKIFGRNIIIQYYYYSAIPASIRIPNACAETIVCFGYLGLALRLGLQLLLFFATRVFRSPFRLWLFLFLFIFQFTGSYITNVTEYVFWMLACSPAIHFFGHRRHVRHP